MTEQAKVLFDQSEDWLTHTLSRGKLASTEQSTTFATGGELRRLDTGILECRPASASTAPALILSAGIHGNETAPIEMLDQLVTGLVAELWRPRIPLLLILGNPPAMASGDRFQKYNLNRLFCGAYNDYPACYESRRAEQLERVCRTFQASLAGPLRHYDLHTAIRSSKREKFALYPFVPGRQVPAEEAALLSEAEIGTLLLQHQPGTTFSSFTAERLGAESFTLELGKVRPFGQNDLQALTPLKQILLRLVTDKPAPDGGPGQLPDTFEVVHEIINTGRHFRFYIEDSAANFTAFPPDTLIWEDDTTSYRTGHKPEAIVFPNPNVPVGHRVGLMVRPRAGTRR